MNVESSSERQNYNLVNPALVFECLIHEILIITLCNPHVTLSNAHFDPEVPPYWRENKMRLYPDSALNIINLVRA